MPTSCDARCGRDIGSAQSLTQALKNYEQAGSKNKTFFAIEDRRLGGLEHCQVDNINVLHEVVLNWLCSIGLGPSAPRPSDF